MILCDDIVTKICNLGMEVAYFKFGYFLNKTFWLALTAQ